MPLKCKHVLNRAYFGAILSYGAKTCTLDRRETRKVEAMGMKFDLLSVVLKTCRFLCKSYTYTELESLLDHLSFDKMKENPSVNYEHVVTRKRLTEETKDLTFFRKGEAGGWRKTMSPELAARFDAWTADKLKGSDYEVDTM
ncbi:unnamed protein product [Timema podura]|uniref:Sulfotransferase domain-containing protein n=1 Tax=Timema podura TaxID=61482 RepID=A0ABN7P5L0_TIMPD|nr:unnamed protein product [Timema podura]